MAPLSSRHRWVPLAEIAVLVAALAATNLVFWPEDPGFAHLAPHPMLFITLLMLARYGLSTGAIAALACAAEHALLIAGPDKSLLLHRLFSTSLSAPLIQLVPMTIFIGMLIQRHIDRSRAAATLKDDLGQRVEQLNRELAELRDVNIQLGERIVHAVSTPAIVFSHVKALYALELPRLSENMLRMLGDLLRIEAASVWWTGEGGMRLVAAIGQHRPKPFPVDGRMARLFNRDVLALQDIPPTERSTECPLLIGRIRAGEGGPIMGFVAIDQLSLRSSVDAMRVFRMVVQWMSSAVGNALTFQRLEARPTGLRVSR